MTENEIEKRFTKLNSSECDAYLNELAQNIHTSGEFLTASKIYKWRCDD